MRLREISISTLSITLSILWMLLGCQQQKAQKEGERSAAGSDSTVTFISLPPLSDAETLCYEDMQRRIKSSWDNDKSLFRIQVDAKQEGIRSFELEGNLMYERVVRGALIVSEGTGTLRELRVYDLNSSDLLLQVERTCGEIEVYPDESGFVCTTLNLDSPQIYWSAKDENWHESNEVPDALYNAQLEQVKKENESHLFDGFSLAAYSRVEVNLIQMKQTPLKELEWGYMQ